MKESEANVEITGHVSAVGGAEREEVVAVDEVVSVQNMVYTEHPAPKAQ